MNSRPRGHVLPAALVLLCALMLPSTLRAETVGVILTGGVDSYRESHEAFLSYLSEKGMLGGLEIIVQTPYPDPIAWSNASRKLIAIGVDVIIAYGSSPSFSVIRERSKIPLIFSDVYEPLLQNISTRNATGISTKYPVSSAIRYLRAAGVLENLGVIYSSIEEDSKYQFREISNYAKRYGFRLTELNIKKPAEASVLLSGTEVSAILITSSSALSSVLPTILRIARSGGIPTVSFIRRGDLHPMILLAPSPEEVGRETARKLVEHLKGKRIRDIPITSASTEILFNLRDAQTLGIIIPMNVVTEATRIIQ